MRNKVLLVDKNDSILGIADKMSVHKNATLHRAFSILIFNEKKELLLQRRSVNKYHTPGLWSNTCCSHQQPGETTVNSGSKRLQEEMGFSCSLNEAFSLIYKFKLNQVLWEHEFNHILFGNYSEKVVPNPNEVDEYRWISLKALKNEINVNPQMFTPWFILILENIFLKFNLSENSIELNKLFGNEFV